MSKTKATIRSFFIFTSYPNENENEENDKILYYHPSHVNIEQQKMQVGLCEAVIKYMSAFSVEDCESLHTQRTRQIFYQPEPHIWIVMVINVPFITRTTSDGTTYMEYCVEEVHRKVLKSALEAGYRLFRLFMGKISSIPAVKLKSKLQSFFIPYLATVIMPTGSTVDIFHGMQHLSLDKTSFFKVLCLVDQVQTFYSDIRQTLFLYNDQLIWTGLSPEDTQVIYKYLVDTLLPVLVKEELHGGAVAAAQHHGRYISPLGGYKKPEDLTQTNKVYLNFDQDGNFQSYYFVAYRALNATVCFCIDDSKDLSLDMLKSLDVFIGPQLTTIASSIAENYISQLQQQTSISDIKFIYFNRLNLAHKSTVKCDVSSPIKQDILDLVADIHTLGRSGERYGEVIIKMTNDFWVVAKSSNKREFYVIIQNKNANLKEINDEVKKICDNQLRGIFFCPT